MIGIIIRALCAGAAAETGRQAAETIWEFFFGEDEGDE